MTRRLGVIAALVLFLAPVVWLFTTAYEPASAIFALPPSLLAGPLTFDNFRTVATLFDLPRLVASSLVISLGSAALALLLGTPAGYALARARAGWASAAASLFLAVRLVPAVATLIPFYLEMRDVGLLGTYWAVVLVDAMQSAAFVVWMMAGAFRAVPREVEDAAALDGSSPLGILLRIALPMARTGLITAALFCVLFAWNDFLTPAFLTTLRTKPLSVALLSAYGTQDITWGTMGALAHFATLPMVAIALLLNRYLIQGFTRGVH